MDRKQSILWIANGFGLCGTGVTGAPVRFHEVSRKWTEKGWSQLLLTTSGGVKLLGDLGCKLPMRLVRAAFLLKQEPIRLFRFYSYCISALFAPRRVDFAADKIITVSDYFCDCIPAIRLKKKLRCKWIAWIHHRELPPSQRPGNRLVNMVSYAIQQWSFRMIARHADQVWVNGTASGEQVKDELVGLGMDVAKIKLMQNGVDCSLIESVAAPEKAFDAIMVGVRPNKGLADILPIWEEVLRLRPGSKLLLAGGMSGEASLLQSINEKGLSSKICVKPGFLPAIEHFAQMKTARILFAPSHEEGWGIFICEAMAAGLPVVAYDLPVFRSIYKGAFAAVTQFETANFARAVVELLSDSERYKTLQMRGHECAKRYDWGLIADQDAQKVGERI